MEQEDLFDSLENILENNLPKSELGKICSILYGHPNFARKLEVLVESTSEFEIKSYKFTAEKDQLGNPRNVRVGLFQNKLPGGDASVPIIELRPKIYEKAENAIKKAALCGVNLFCFSETWNMPFAFAIKEKFPWVEWSESAENGPTTKFLQNLAKMHNMVIISPILERDENEICWNTAVVISNMGKVLGKSRKNHIPRVDDCSESFYYMESTLGHPVFETEFGKIAINICYGRQHPLNWLMFGLNGAEIVFNPSANDGIYSESNWGIAGRNAAIANHYFTCSVNRVGIETFPHPLFPGKMIGYNSSGHFYGSSYVTSPDGSRTPGLSRVKEGLLVVEMDLNLNRHLKDKWGFKMTQRLWYYANKFKEASKPDFKPNFIS